MADWLTVASVADFQDDDRITVEIDEMYVAVFKVGDAYYAIEDVCTHDDGPLAEGDRDGYEIACPRHGAKFDLRSGKVLSLPAITSIRSFPARLLGDEVQIEWDE